MLYCYLLDLLSLYLFTGHSITSINICRQEAFMMILKKGFASG